MIYDYNYSIQDDFPNHKVETSVLASEIRASAITVSLDSIYTEGDDCYINFKAELSVDEKAILDGLVAAHTGELPKPIEKVQLAGFPDMEGWYYKRYGYNWDMTFGQTTDKDIKFDTDIRLGGGGFKVNSNVNDGDYIEFSIVDKDGILGLPPGTVLNTFIVKEYLWPEREFDIMMDDAVLIQAGLYLRCSYCSTGSENVNMKAWYHTRYVPS